MVGALGGKDSSIPVTSTSGDSDVHPGTETTNLNTVPSLKKETGLAALLNPFITVCANCACPIQLTHQGPFLDLIVFNIFYSQLEGGRDTLSLPWASALPPAGGAHAEGLRRVQGGAPQICAGGRVITEPTLWLYSFQNLFFSD